MAAAGAIQDLCDELTCPVCLDYFRDPVIVVGCGHNFCRACLAPCVRTASCPQCRGTVRPKGFFPNRKLKDVVEIAKKLSRRGPSRAGEGGFPRVRAPAATVTLDPDTAHPLLVLSEDRKSVRWGDKWQDLPDNPERFDCFSFVLGCEGFTTGTHFWNVDVGSGEWWAVGVARKSVRRKGWFDFSPKEGIWAMGKWGGQYQVFTAPHRIPLSLGQQIRRIQVTLNCAEGQVGFSNADSGVHLYTFSGASFCRETLLPFFRVFDNAHLRLNP